MKILVLTDSHGHFSFLIEMIEKEKPDVVFTTGDYSTDFEELSYLYPAVPFHIVRGNCDFCDRKNPDEKIIEIEGKRILLTHGHLYGVKSSLTALAKRGRDLSCELVAFGHTHREYFEAGEMIFVNPGAAQDRKYGIINITNGELLVILKKL